MATKPLTNSPIPSSFGLDKFRGQMNAHGGPAKSNRFTVRILPSRNAGTFRNFIGDSASIINDIPFLCESAEIPGRGLESVDARYYGPNQKLPFQTRYEDMNLVFICRTRFLERQFFDDWMNVIHPNNTYDFLYLHDYSCNIEIFSLSDVAVGGEGENTYGQYKVTLEDAYPVLVNPQPITWADSEFLRLGVSFTYKRYVREKLDPANLPDLSDIQFATTLVEPRQ